MELLKQRQVCAIAWETLQRDDGFLPVLHCISTIAGRLMPQIVGRFLQADAGGRGVSLSGCPTVPPAEVVILGAGTFGTEAARALAGNRASVYLLDIDPMALERAEQAVGGRVVTMAATRENLAKVVRFADAIIGAVHIPGQRAPIVLTREHLRAMRPRSLFVDAAIDQGGCAETSHPTDHGSPIYMDEGVNHYCVPNITSIVGRTATHALTYIITPYLLAIANLGLDVAVDKYPELARGINVRDGQVVHPGLVETMRAEEGV